MVSDADKISDYFILLPVWLMNCEGFGRGLFCVLSGHLPGWSKGKHEGIHGLRYYGRHSERLPRRVSSSLLWCSFYSHFWYDNVITFIIYHAVCCECDHKTAHSTFVAFSVSLTSVLWSVYKDKRIIFDRFTFNMSQVMCIQWFHITVAIYLVYIGTFVYFQHSHPVWAFK